LSNSDNNALIKKIAYEGRGRILDDPSQVFKSELPPVTGKTDPFYVLIIALLVLFMLDVALRRLNLRFDVWKKKLEPAQAISRAAVGKFIHIVSTPGKKLKRKNKAMQFDDNKSKINIKSEGKTSKPKQKPEKPDKEMNLDSHISQLLDKKRKWKN